MNKPYFAKFLAIEGEIEEGDVVKTMGEERTTFKKGMNERAYQKYKLFLCSKDIQIGDKDIHTGIIQDYGEEIVKEVKHLYQLEFMKGISEASHSELYKVVGEISPEATWVKKGDEYLFGKVDKNGYICPYNQADEKYINFWTERSFRDLPNI